MAAAAKKILVTGSNGLIGSVEHFAGQGHIVHGIDNNMRADFFAAPRTAEVYNLGGGRESNASILELFAMIEEATGKRVSWRYDETNREGDHICYITDMAKFRSHYPGWNLTRRLEDIVQEMIRLDVIETASPSGRLEVGEAARALTRRRSRR